jgi:hypothetical protein
MSSVDVPKGLVVVGVEGAQHARRVCVLLDVRIRRLAFRELLQN